MPTNQLHHPLRSVFAGLQRRNHGSGVPSLPLRGFAPTTPSALPASDRERKKRAHNAIGRNSSHPSKEISPVVGPWSTIHDLGSQRQQCRLSSSSCSSSSVLSKRAATQTPGFPPGQRWKAVPPANLLHLSIGGVYAYSMWTPALTRALGVVSSAPLDWTHAQVLPVFSCAALSLGATTHFLGSWVESVGPRTAGAVGSLVWSAALVTTGAGVYFHQLPLVYAGYSVLGGIGWGLMYLSPVTTVMKWFPDRRGLATGIALSAFGVGAAVAPALIHGAMEFFAVAPDYLGPLAAPAGALPGTASPSFVELATLPDGSQVVAGGSSLGTPGQPVVVATEADLAKVSGVHTGPGVYALGTGDTGAAKAFWAVGSLYGALGLLGSRYMMLPHSDWTPSGTVAKEPTGKDHESNPSDPPHRTGDEGAITTRETASSNDVGLPASYVTTSTTQYPLLWLGVFGNATGGLALLSSSKLMMTDIWAGVAPSVVTASFATGYVSSLGVGMAVGRFGWSALSDSLGRKNTYSLFGLGIPLVGLAPHLAHAAAETASVGGMESEQLVVPYLWAFYGGSVLAITFYGGIFSALPAYIADLFGQKHAGAIHGKLLTAWAASAVVGPMGLGYLRSRSVDNAVGDLLEAIGNGGQEADEARKSVFEETFGCGLDDTETIEKLIDAKTISIGRLMELVPEGTVDPTPFLYDTTCYASAGFMGIALLANLAIRPLEFVKIGARAREPNDENGPRQETESKS
ncbi:unnamed protein product [Pseudo-nitzschia multistriata]|uniref:Major facilitator superfamily (MFS) profile domain-containing protein n=1 Tax=Pseudo-nitzschia multistriata TaxID=183589 RepID=A0A448ZC23_9STRA|nr:unnamed protein product [Pseudo-nitzschia multistriata]